MSNEKKQMSIYLTQKQLEKIQYLSNEVFSRRGEAFLVEKLQHGHFSDYFLTWYGFLCALITVAKLDGGNVKKEKVDDLMAMHARLIGRILTVSGVTGISLSNYLYSCGFSLFQIFEEAKEV